MQKSRGFEKISFERWDKDNEIIPESKQAWKEIKLPKRATKYSAGYDVYSTVDFILNPGDEIKIPLGWKVYMQQDEFLMIVPRSGLGFTFYTRLANSVGIVDYDYFNNEVNEGHCWLKLRNEGNKILSIRSGEAVAQGIFQKYLLMDEDSYLKGEKRAGGFGSTS